MKALLVLIIPLLLVTALAFSNVSINNVSAQQNQTSAAQQNQTSAAQQNQTSSEQSQGKEKLNPDQLLNYTNQAIIDIKDVKGKDAKSVEDNLHKIQQALINATGKSVVVSPSESSSGSSSKSSSDSSSK